MVKNIVFRHNEDCFNKKIINFLNFANNLTADLNLNRSLTFFYIKFKNDIYSLTQKAYS